MQPHTRNRLLTIVVIVLFLVALLGTSIKALTSSSTSERNGTMAPGMRMP